MKKRLITALLVATGVFGAVIGLAASLTVNADQLGSGTGAVSSCDTDGVTTSYTYNANGGITAVVVEGIQDGGLLAGQGSCDNETVYVEVLDASSAVLANGTGSTGVGVGDLNTTDDTVTVNLAGAVSAVSVENARVTITG
jgi:YD repeat-containing protein